MADRQFEQLCGFLGTWRGEGRVRFPTIDDFSYVEETVFRTRGEDEPSLHFEQRTWVFDELGDRSPSHWETGFFQVNEAGRIEVLTAQNSGRVEVLVGGFIRPQGAAPELRLVLESVVHAHDARMVRSRREYALAGSALTYEMSMATTAVSQLASHLSATLSRIPS